MGGFVGWLAASGDLSAENMASRRDLRLGHGPGYCVERFGPERT